MNASMCARKNILPTVWLTKSRLYWPRGSPLQSAIEQTKLDVRHYAKRQLTWFRREPGVEWFYGFGEDADTQSAILQTLAYPPAEI